METGWEIMATTIRGVRASPDAGLEVKAVFQHGPR